MLRIFSKRIINFTWYTVVDFQENGVEILLHDRLHNNRDQALQDRIESSPLYRPDSFQIVEDENRTALAVKINGGVEESYVIVNPANVFDYCTATSFLDFL